MKCQLHLLRPILQSILGDHFASRKMTFYIFWSFHYNGHTTERKSDFPWYWGYLLHINSTNEKKCKYKYFFLFKPILHVKGKAAYSLYWIIVQLCNAL